MAAAAAAATEVDKSKGEWPEITEINSCLLKVSDDREEKGLVEICS